MWTGGIENAYKSTKKTFFFKLGGFQHQLNCVWLQPEPPQIVQPPV